jgi:hypothetical protein
MIKGYREGRELQLGSKVRSMMWGTSLKRGDGSEETADASMQFLDDDNVPHVLLLAFKTDSLSNIQNDLLFEIAKFNFENYLVKDFDLEIIDTGNGLSVLVISGFDNLDIAKYFTPSLTTVKQDFIALGENAFTLLRQAIKGNKTKRITIHTEPIFRDSTAPAKQ